MFHRDILVEEGGKYLLIIDPQVDFHEGGSLAVKGATEDSKRISRMIKNNPEFFDEIFITLDTHHKKNIAHASFWSDKEDDIEGLGNSPSPLTTITYDDVLNNKWYPRDCSLKGHCLEYTRSLKYSGKNKLDLTIWPDHCLIGTVGHAVQQDIHDAVTEWDVQHSNKTVHYIHKGMNCLTDMYSAIEAEYEIKNDNTTTHNEELLAALASADKLYICGQALSHCVNYTTRDIMECWENKRKNLKDIILLLDGTSPVENFEHIGQQFVKYFEQKGGTVGKISDLFADVSQISHTSQ